LPNKYDKKYFWFGQKNNINIKCAQTKNLKKIRAYRNYTNCNMPYGTVLHCSIIGHITIVAMTLSPTLA
jgi:hypothetical protein